MYSKFPFLFFSYTFPSIQTYHFDKICVWHFDLKLTFLHRRLRYRQRSKIEESEKFQLGLELKWGRHWTVLGSVRGLSKRGTLSQRKLGLWFPRADRRNWTLLRKSVRRRSSGSGSNPTLEIMNWDAFLIFAPKSDIEFGDLQEIIIYTVHGWRVPP